MDDAINVHPVKHGVGLGRLDGVHVHLLPGLGLGEDCWAIAHILLQGGPEIRVKTFGFLMVCCVRDIFWNSFPHG